MSLYIMSDFSKFLEQGRADLDRVAEFLGSAPRWMNRSDDAGATVSGMDADGTPLLELARQSGDEAILALFESVDSGEAKP